MKDKDRKRLSKFLCMLLRHKPEGFKLKLDKRGKVISSPEMERRIKIYRKWQKNFGDIIVQLNIEDKRLGVAEYVVEKLGIDSIELKWGQGAKCIGGEIKIRDLNRALELQKRGYIVTPNPSDLAIQDAFKKGGKLGYVNEKVWTPVKQQIAKDIQTQHNFANVDVNVD